MKFKMSIPEHKGSILLGNGYLPSPEHYSCSFNNTKSFVVTTNHLGELDSKSFIGFCFISQQLVDTVAGCAFSSMMTKGFEEARQAIVVMKKNQIKAGKIRDEGYATLLEPDDSTI